MTRRRFPAATTLLLLAGTVALFFRPLFLGETFVERDLDAYYRPAKMLLVRLFHEAGELPLWNPYFSFGQPFAANPEHELFHPATTLLFLLPFEWAFRLPIILGPALAALSMLFFLRTLGRSRSAALVGALSWGFGGTFLSTANLLPILYAVVPLPAALAFLLRAWRRGRLSDAAGLALCGGLTGLAGEPSTLISAVALGALTLAAHGRRRAHPGVAAWGVLLAIGIAAPALLPGLRHANLTIRAMGLPEETVRAWSFPLVRLTELALPRALGHVERDDLAWYWGRHLYPERGAPFLYGIYPGLLITTLAVAGACRRSFKSAVWTAGALVAVVVAAGPALGALRVMRALPVLNGIRYPEKFLLVACFAMVVLGATGWDVSRERATRRRVQTALIVFAAATALAAMAFAFFPAPAALVPPAYVGRLAGILRCDLLIAAVVGTLSAAALGGTRRLRPELAGVLLVADITVVGAGFVRTRPIAEVHQPHPVLAPLAAHPPDGPIVDLLLDANLFRRLRAVRFLSEPRPAQWGIATALGDDFDLTNLRWTSRAAELFWKAVAKQPSLLAPMLARRSVSGLVVPRAEPDGRIQMALVRPTGRRPFAFFAERVEVLASDEAWPETMRRLGAAASGAVCLSAADAPGDDARSGSGRVLRIERSPDRVALDVENSGAAPALLAVNQTWAPGWSASVDGRAARLLRADVDLTALAVRPGERRVTLAYHDPSVPASLAAALAALAAAGALLVLERRRLSRQDSVEVARK